MMLEVGLLNIIFGLVTLKAASNKLDEDNQTQGHILMYAAAVILGVGIGMFFSQI